MTRTAQAAVRVTTPLNAGRGGQRALVALCALALWLFAFSPAAQAGPPTHLHLPALTIDGSGKTAAPKELNRACGAAVDTEGNVYVASAGISAIDVFDPDHVHLATIANANEPCGLAVDSKGNLYVSEAKTGNVLRYTPNAYPFTGTPSYGAPVTIDASGEAKGISVDPIDDRLYVARGDHIATYGSDGTLGINELQRLRVSGEVTGGTFTLTFGTTAPTTTGPIAFDAPATGPGSVQEALEGLGDIAPGDVSVIREVVPPEQSTGGGFSYFITFTGALGSTDVAQIVMDGSALTGAGFHSATTVTNGFSGLLGAGDLTNASGVAAYTYPGSGKTRYLFAADAATDTVEIFTGPSLTGFKHRQTIEAVDHDRDPDTAEQELGFGSAGAAVGIDRSNGHFFVYDDAHEALDEFEPLGRFFTQVPSPEPPFEFEDALPTAIALDNSSGPGSGRLYVTSGAGAGAKLLAFGPAVIPDRLPLSAPHSFAHPNACGVAVDSHGNRYVSADQTIYVYPPGGDVPLTTINGGGTVCDVEVDSSGKVYALINGGSFEVEQAKEKVAYFTPAAFPPVSGTTYGAPTTVAVRADFNELLTDIKEIALNPANDRLFATNQNKTIEYDSAANGSAILNPDFAAGVGLNTRKRIAVYGANGNFYILYGSGVESIAVINPSGTEVLAQMNGLGSPKGAFGANGRNNSIAVDQSNGHVLLFVAPRGVAEEYEPSGGFVGQFGSFNTGFFGGSVAIDNSGTATDGNLYVAYNQSLTAFGPLSYGEAPLAVSGLATEVKGGNATLNGTVDPRGFELESCRFEYTDETDFEANGFAGAEIAPCDPDIAEIGSGSGAVAVKAEISGLDTEARYRFRLFAQNEYGTSAGKAGIFGPPILTTKAAQPVAYTEATLRALIDPSGLPTTYRFQYGTGGAYGQSTPEVEIPPSAGPTEVAAPIVGLEEGTAYHFRILVENEAKAIEGPDQSLETLQRPSAQECPNEELRIGHSARLPDCRAYELVTPAGTRGLPPYAAQSGTSQLPVFNQRLISPSGDRLTFSLDGTLPGFEGNGERDGYRSTRTASGWQTESFGPSYTEAGGAPPSPQGVSADQRHWIWEVTPLQSYQGTLDPGTHLLTPSGYEPLGQGSLGTDPDAVGDYLSEDASHVIFSSKAQLEEAAAPVGTTAIYDRAANSDSAEVISIRPDGEPFAPGESATYLGVGEDGEAVAFKVAGTLYLHGDGATTEIAPAPNTYAGVSADGERVFYVAADFKGQEGTPGPLHACDVGAAPCGPESEIAPNSLFVNVSADGSSAYLTSKDVLDDAEEGVVGEDNLYLWRDDGQLRFIAALHSQDLSGGGFEDNVGLVQWLAAVGPGGNRAYSPTRSTSDGSALLFLSHADLTSYQALGSAQAYLYDAEADQILCLSCDPGGEPPQGEAGLQDLFGGATHRSTIVENLTADGEKAFFESEDALSPEDANSVKDVYEWQAQGSGGCKAPSGCLALISSGQGERPSLIYSVSPDGSDVFFQTEEKLVGADVPGSPSLYDAREGGGIAEAPAKAPCQGDSCQGNGTIPPALAIPPSSDLGEGGNVDGAGTAKKSCAKGKRKVRRAGKTRCVKRKAKRQRKANHKRRAGR